MHTSFLLAGAGLAQLAFGQVHIDEQREVVPRAATSAATVTRTVTAAAQTVTKTVTAQCSTAKVSTSTQASTMAKAVTTSKAATTATAAASTASTAAATATSGISINSLSPNGIKAGLSGFVNIDYYPAFTQLAPYISWYSDYYPNTPDSQGVLGVGMLWGADGSACTGVYDDPLQTFKNMITGGTVPSIMFGFYEPDCSCSSSSDMSVANAIADWNYYLGPLKAEGTVLGSPSMCEQYDETFLTPFEAGVTVPWDVTSIHINKPNLTEVQKDVDYYWTTYGKPIWVSEFACVHDQPNWDPSTNQTEINNFIAEVVPYFENNPHVVAYGASNGEGLGSTWPLIDSNTNDLSATGQAYLQALQAL